MSSSTSVIHNQSGFTRRDFLKASALAALGLAGSSVLSSCNSGGPSGNLTYLSGDTSDAEQEVYQSWISSFKEANSGVEITGEHLSYGTDFLTKLDALVAAGTPPDFVPRWFSDEALSFWDKGELKPVNNLMEKLGMDGWDESSLRKFRIGDDYIGVPYTVSAFPFFWRKDLIDKHGLQIPETWNDLIAAAQALTEDTDGNGEVDIYGTVVPYGRNSQTSYLFWMMIWTNGGYVVDQDLNVSLNSPQVVETLDFLKELAQYSPPGSAEYSWGENVGAFVSGLSASVLYQGRVFTNIANENPDLADKITVGPIPYGKEPATLGLWAGSSIFSGSDNVESAEAFIEHIHKPAEYVKWLAILPGHYWASRLTMLDQPEFAELPLVQKYQNEIKRIASYTDGARSFSQESPDHKINPYSTAILGSNVLADMVQMVLIQGDSAQKAAEWGATQVKDLMTS